jgi:hypothetical protein
MSNLNETIDVEIRCTDTVAKIIAKYGHAEFGIRGAKLDTMVGLTIIALMQEKIDDFEKVNAYLSTNAKCRDRKEIKHNNVIIIGDVFGHNKTGKLWRVQSVYRRIGGLKHPRMFCRVSEVGGLKRKEYRVDYFKKTFSILNETFIHQNAQKMLS